jgi:REP element-mobilizing transposase RayT
MSHWKIFPDTEDQFYFLTATICDWEYVFTEPQYFQIIVESLSFCQRNKDLRLAGYVIMPNHLHLIGAGSKVFPLSDTLRDFKQFAAKKILQELESDGRSNLLSRFSSAARYDGRGNEHKVWMEGNHPILIDSEEMFTQKLEYIHENPVRKGYVDKPEAWLYSSARDYLLADDSDSPLKVERLA